MRYVVHLGCLVAVLIWSASGFAGELSQHASALAIPVAASGGTSRTTQPVMRPTLVQSADRNCTCRYFGEKYSIGETVCLRGPEGPRMARCAMNQNNTSWKMLEDPCPTARLCPRLDMAARAG
ncbi:hypothetical protein [Stappia sp. ICDLI1TA098]